MSTWINGSAIASEHVIGSNGARQGREPKANEIRLIARGCGAISLQLTRTLVYVEVSERRTRFDDDYLAESGLVSLYEIWRKTRS